jgi:hypothetical protein
MQMQDGESIPVSAEARAAEAGVVEIVGSVGIPPGSGAGTVMTNHAAGREKAALPLIDGELLESESRKESAMIDVHAPHGGIHTWRDFWIHLGTIALGLLIAIGLEQTVEWMHHLHQRHQLEEDLHTEAEKNHAAVAGDIENGEARTVRLLALRDAVNRMRDSGGRLKLDYIPYSTDDPSTNRHLPPQVLPSNAAWATAKESQLVGLLPRPEAEMYSRLDVQHDRLTEVVQHWLEENRALEAFETRFREQGSRTPDMRRMSVEQLDEYSVLLSNGISGLDELGSRLRRFDLESEAIRHGARTEEEMMREAVQVTGP